ncbi:oxidoreductase [Synechococcus sp. AH-736-M02]|nr:oxidoreductase [Synechococcus sp. AH-736-M02]
MSVPVRSTLRSTLLWAVVPAAIVYAVALVWSGAEGISAKLVLKDLAQSCKAPLGEGFLSSVGYLLWMAAAAIALFAASTRQIQGSVLNRQFAFCGGGFSLWLCLDDMFLVHDRYLGEAFLYITYAFFTGLLLFRFRGPLRRFGGDTFLVSVVLLGLSVLTDALQGCGRIPMRRCRSLRRDSSSLGLPPGSVFGAITSVPPPSRPPLSSTNRFALSR